MLSEKDYRTFFETIKKVANEWREKPDGTVELRGTLTKDEKNAVGAALASMIFSGGLK